MQEEGISNVARYLPQLAASSPERTALRIPLPKSVQKLSATGTCDGYLSLSYARVEALASGLCHAFAERGVTRGMRVLLMLRPGRDLILTVFALFKMGAVPVVIDPGMGLKAFRACVVRTRPEALVGISAGHAIAAVFRKDFACARIRVTLGGRTGLGALLGGTLGEDRLEAFVKGQPTHFEPVATRRDDLAAILFTSGSTGAPKGVCYEHGMFEAQVRMVREAYGIEPGEVDLPLLPVFALFGPALGFTSVVPEMNPSKPASVDPALLVRAIEDNAVTNSFGSPVLWTKIATYCEAHGKTLPTLRRVLMAGAPAHPTLLRRMEKLLPNGEVHTPYGATEVLPVSSISGREILEQTAALTQQGFGTCVGRLLPGVRVRIIAAGEDSTSGPAVTPPPPRIISAAGDDGGTSATAAGSAAAPAFPTFASLRILPAGQIGEIVVTGPSVTKAYDNLPEATARAKIWDEQEQTLWHRMGDVGALDAQGRLWFCGRKVERVFLADANASVEAPVSVASVACAEASASAAMSVSTAPAGSVGAAVPDASAGSTASVVLDAPVCATAPAGSVGASPSLKSAALAADAFVGEIFGAESPALVALREQRVLCTDCVEGIMNTHPQVFRTALVGVGGQAHLMVEPWPSDWPKTPAQAAAFEQSLRALAAEHALTRSLRAFHFRKRFPVDVRHNAKIHRLTMARELAVKLQVAPN